MSSLRSRLLSAAWLVAAACAPKAASRPPAPDVAAPDTPDTGARALAALDGLEADIAAGRADRADRKRAYETAAALPDDGSAAYALARAALAGRLAEARGANAGRLVGEAEAWALRSIERDPGFRDGAATRLLGSLYVLAPPRLLAHGDSEKGLAMLEGLVREHPDDPRAHLRLAEAYVALGDPEAALPALCVARAGAKTLPGDERHLLDRLVEDVGGPEMLDCQTP